MPKEVDRNHIINGWLKYHNLTVDELVKIETKEFLQSPEWFKKYAVTQEQHDEWVAWAKDYIHKETRLSKKMIEKGWWSVYLDIAPSINQY